MTPPKPPAAPSAAHPLPPPLTSRLHLPIVLKGPSFAGVLAQTPVKPSPQAAPVMPAMQVANHPVVTPVGREPEKRGHKGEPDLDAVFRQTAQLAPPMVQPAIMEAAAAAQQNARVSLEDLVPQLVKKIAWSGDARHGTVRMELGSGELAGATVTVSAEHGRVTVNVDVPPGTDAASWRARLTRRLESRGLSIDSVEVR